MPPAVSTAGPSGASSDPPIELPSGSVGMDTFPVTDDFLFGEVDEEEADEYWDSDDNMSPDADDGDDDGDDWAAGGGSERRREDGAGFAGRSTRRSAVGAQLQLQQPEQQQQEELSGAEVLYAAYAVRMPTVCMLGGVQRGAGSGAPQVVHDSRDNYSAVHVSVSNMTPTREERLQAAHRSEPLFIGDLTPLELIL
jgi:hypothetical protein